MESSSESEVEDEVLLQQEEEVCVSQEKNL